MKCDAPRTMKKTLISYMYRLEKSDKMVNLTFNQRKSYGSLCGQIIETKTVKPISKQCILDSSDRFLHGYAVISIIKTATNLCNLCEINLNLIKYHPQLTIKLPREGQTALPLNLNDKNIPSTDFFLVF